MTENRKWPENACFCPTWQEYIDDQTQNTLIFIPKFREIGIPLTSESLLLVTNCPFCGSKLPESLRDQWFEKMVEIFGDSWNPEDGVPAEFEDQIWWDNNK